MKEVMKNLDLLFSLATPFRLVHEDPPVDDTSEADAAAAETARLAEANKKKTTPVKLDEATQKYVNSLLAEEKRKGQTATHKAVTELETIRNQAGTTAAERDRLNERIEELQNQHVTEKELTAKDLKKKETAQAAKLKAAEDEAARWKDLFNTTTIKRSIVDAALVKEHKAHNPQHVVNMLAPVTRLVEEMDEDNKPTGEYIAKAKVRTVKDGKPTVLEMTVTEAVKFMSEQEEHAPLFDSGVSGGLGGNPNRPRSKGDERDPNVPPTDQAEYRAWRAKNRSAVGASGKGSSK